VWHVFYNEAVVISKIRRSNINRQMRVMNRAYRDARFKFSIQKVIYYKDSPYYSSCDESMRVQYRVGNLDTLNIYTCAYADLGYLGLASLPQWFQGNLDPAGIGSDGIIIDFGTLPRGDIQKYNLGKTLVHETGHWLGLYHTWGVLNTGTCQVDELNGDDLVADTPLMANREFDVLSVGSPVDCLALLSEHRRLCHCVPVAKLYGCSPLTTPLPPPAPSPSAQPRTGVPPRRPRTLAPVGGPSGSTLTPTLWCAVVEAVGCIWFGLFCGLGWLPDR